jgi:hypothetical protein
VTQAVQATVQLINTVVPATTTPAASGTGDGSAAGSKAADRQAAPAQAEHTGVKNEKPATKLYCN